MITNLWISRQVSSNLLIEYNFVLEPLNRSVKHRSFIAGRILCIHSRKHLVGNQNWYNNGMLISNKCTTRIPQIKRDTYILFLVCYRIVWIFINICWIIHYDHYNVHNFRPRSRPRMSSDISSYECERCEGEFRISVITFHRNGISFSSRG